MSCSIETQIKLFYSMLRIRKIEEAIADHYPEQKMRTPVHLSIGQEAVAAILGHLLEKEDLAVSTHRGHAHYLGKGGSLKAMIAEIYGKVTGCCRGRGGSMHLIDRSVGFMGSTAIVGNTIPIGIGLGLSLKLSGKNQVSCIFVGDAAVEEGVFYESLNFAVLKNLPVLFICENNRCSVYTPFEKRQPSYRNIYDIAAAMGAKISHADGYELLACYEIVEQTLHSMRQGEGPYFLEFETYRFREHCGPHFDFDINYRTEEEYLSWKKRDPIDVIKFQLLDGKHLSLQKIAEIEQQIKIEIEDAFSFAEMSAFPDAIEAVTGQYKTAEIQHQSHDYTRNVLGI
jgi:TPP-dependent pyruvate/acetoin dehydrogenase alpha subunit